MPIVTFHVVRGRHDDDALAHLLRRASQLFAEVTESPIARTRAFVDEHPATRACVGGELVSQGADEAPFFQAYLLAGRPQGQRDRLMSGFTDLLVEILGTDRSVIRGAIIIVEPNDWCIAGVSAAELRADEIRARAAQG